VWNDVESRQIARGKLKRLDDEKLILSVPHTDYELHFKPGVPAAEIDTPIGKRIKGTIRGAAQRMYLAGAGGRFIEPAQGEPRIVTGTVLAVDEPNRRVLVDVAVPMWLTTRNGQDYSFLREGVMVNCYIESGATFTPLNATESR
jgi:hypothetical protein